MKKRIYKEIVSWGLIIVIALILAVFINKVIIFKAEPISGSMENTIMIEEDVITFRLAYLFNPPMRGDIVVFKFPDNEEEDYIKRVIGCPGETIEGKNGLVYIDGVAIEEDYITEALDNDFGPYQVPEDSYFMMGDNRNASVDSREWNNKFVSKDKIYGKVLFKFPSFKKLY